MTEEFTQSPIERAVAIAGTQAALAIALGLSAPTVNEWVTGKRPIPAVQCRPIERVTKGQVTAEQLRPDIFAPIEVML